MYPLSRIIEHLGPFAQTIKSILGTEVLIVDDTFTRLVSTESARQCSKIDNQSVFARALKENAPYIIENPRLDRMCMHCSDREICLEHALVCVPISVENKAVGVIGLIAMSEAEKNALLSKPEDLLRFLDHIAGLIAIQLVQKQGEEQISILASELNCLFEAIEKPMFISNHMGEVLRYNPASLVYFKNKIAFDEGALKLFTISEQYKTHGVQRNKKYRLQMKNTFLTGTYNKYPISGYDPPHYVFVLEDSSAILGMYRAVVNDSTSFSFDQLIGTSPLFLDAVDRAKRGAQTDLSLLLLGESGTGKELFAKAIHHASDRQLAPFVAINCAAIPEHLLEAELFGYEEGAFTGAMKGGKSGKFELAHGGTIFLDEIGDMPLPLQAKLLRVLQDGYITRVGAHFGHHVNVRIMSATHQSLSNKINEGGFRKDLFYRIAAYPIELPALRDRITDIPQLVHYFIEKHTKKQPFKSYKVESEAMETLINHNWDGNVRELENAVAYALSFCSNNVIQKIHLPMTLLNATKVHLSIGITHLEESFSQALIKYGTSKEGRLAIQNSLKISRATYYRHLKNLKTESRRVSY